MKTAHYLGKYKNKRVYRFPVTVRLNNSRDHTTWCSAPEYHFEVVANTPADAANTIRNEWQTRAETEVFAYGPKGGETYRYIGFESAIFAAMFLQPKDNQISLL